MTLRPWVSREFGRLVVGIAMAGALSCAPYPSARRSEFRDDYSRAPGSFCALNPEGCPPPASPPTQASPGPFDLNSCLEACEAGGAVLDNYCRGLQEAWQRRLCWSVVLGSKAACRGMCHRLHACETDAQCPERKD